MLAYIGRRISALLVILFGSTFLVYIAQGYSGDPSQALRGSTDPHVKAQLASLIRNLNLNVPPPARYFLWLKGVLGIFVGHFNLGLTRDRNPVSTYILEAIPVTMRSPSSLS